MIRNFCDICLVSEILTTGEAKHNHSVKKQRRESRFSGVCPALSPVPQNLPLTIIESFVIIILQKWKVFNIRTMMNINTIALF